MAGRKHKLDEQNENDRITSITVVDDDSDGDKDDTAFVPLKRIRGGGPFGGDGDGFHESEQLFDEDDDDEAGMALDEPPEPFDDNDNDTAYKSKKDDTVYSGITESMQSRWLRPSVPPQHQSTNSDLNLQWLDMDVVGGDPLPVNPAKGKRVLGSTQGRVPILRMYGTNEHGNSVAVFIHGFTPYGYFAIPKDCEFDDSAENLSRIRTILDARLQQQARGADSKNGGRSYCHGVTYVKDHKSIMGYETAHTRFFRVLVAMPTMIPTIKRIMEDGIELPGVRSKESTASSMVCFPAFECNIPFVLRYMIDSGISGAGWLTLPKSTYKLRSGAEKRTNSQIEVDIVYNELIVRKSEGEWNKIAPLRILSFDIECQGRKGQFPEAEKDPVIQISNVLTVYGEDNKTPVVQVRKHDRYLLPLLFAFYCFVSLSKSRLSLVLHLFAFFIHSFIHSFLPWTTDPRSLHIRHCLFNHYRCNHHRTSLH